MTHAVTLTDDEREQLYGPIGNDESYPELPSVVADLITARVEGLTADLAIAREQLDQWGESVEAELAALGAAWDRENEWRREVEANLEDERQRRMNTFRMWEECATKYVAAKERAEDAERVIANVRALGGSWVGFDSSHHYGDAVLMALLPTTDVIPPEVPKP